MTTASPRQANQEEPYGWVLMHAAAVRGYLLGLVRRPDAADDLAQEVFRRAWQARERYRDEGHARAYLLTIADRLACDRGRRLGVELTLDEESWRGLEPTADKSSPVEELIKQETADELAAALDRLSPMQRRVLLLRYYGGLEFAQIAAIVSCPLNTVLSHCRRGLLSLRGMLAESFP